MKTGVAGIALIKNFEGCRLTAYKPVPTEVKYTIGYGHYGVEAGTTITQAEADALLIKDLAKFEAYVNNPAYVPLTAKLTQNQFDALVSFCYNCGAGSLKTLCKGRSLQEVAKAIPLYNKAGGKVLDGLTRRRTAEVELFNKEAVQVGKTGFNDVPDKHWAAGAILAAKNAGIMTGDGSGNFNPDKPVTRAELAAVVAKLLNK